MAKPEIVFTVILLLPLLMILAGWGLLWAGSWSRHRSRSANPFDRSPSVLTVMGLVLLVLGVFTFAVVAVSWLSPFIIVVMAIVIVAALVRYLQSEVKYLVWNLAEAADRGIPLEKAARAFAAERGGYLATSARGLADYLDAAVPLSLALARSGLWVSAEITLAADIGQRTGTLGPSLQKAVEQSDTFDRSLSSIVMKFIYLSWIALVMCVIVTFMMIKIVPTFVQMFEEFGIELPTATVWLIEISRAIVSYWYLLVPFMMLLAVVCVVGVVSYIGFSVQTLPVVRMLFAPIDSATVLHSLSTAVQRKQTVPENLQLLANLARSYRSRRKLERAVEQVSDGAHWCSALQHAGFISSAQSGVLVSAERAGNLAWALDEMADSSIRRATQRAQAVLSFVFPSLLVAFGFCVFFVAVGMLLPLFTLISILS